ncbi:MAG: thiamine phosphate synthase [Bacteroidales bacterium]|nr:thiamine phosphate synthase [Bacteroidales bacterium]
MEIAMNRINKGIYLIVNPSDDLKKIHSCLEKVLPLPVCAVQLWDNFSSDEQARKIIENLTEICHHYNKPILINNRWEWLLQYPLDGVHFDNIPEQLQGIVQTVGRSFLKGLTCNNDLKTVEWAYKNSFDYISFCSMFPSITANSCELVDRHVVKRAIEHFSLPVFLAGGITPENLKELSDISYHGIAVVSGIMSANDPVKAAEQYLKQIKL